MTDRRRTRALAILCILLAVSPAAAIATAGAQTESIDRQADLAIQQPHYIGSDVQQTTNNGTRLYRVGGERLSLSPQNVDTDRVIDFGVRGTTGSLTFDREFGSYQLHAENGTGTYEVYWTVNEVVHENATDGEAATGADGNETATATPTSTSGQMQTVRYSALVRVTGGVDLEHKEAEESSQLRQDALKWREFNSTIHNADLVEPGVDPETTVQEMINWYQVRKDPLAALTGNLTAVVILLVSTVGGGLVLFGLGIYHEVIVQRLYRLLNLHESIEAEEGAAKETIEELEQREKMQSLQNMDWQDIFNDDHVAAAFREQFGETVGEGTVEYLSVTRPRNILRDRLQAMGQDGYVAVVDERTVTDGGDDGDQSIASAHIEHAEQVPDDAETVDLSDADTDRLDALLDRDVLEWDATSIRTFDLPDAEYDPDDLETTYESMDLPTLLEELRADMRHFDSPKAYGEYMREFLQAVRDHPFCDEQGRPDELRYAMTQFLQFSQLLDDRFDYPLMHWHSQAWERAVIDYDPEREAAELVERIQQGGA